MPDRTFRPARFERVRCALARTLFRSTLTAADASASVAPRNHPWRLLSKSAVEDLSCVTTATLTPRTAGNPAPIPRLERRGRIRLKWALASYLLVAQFLPILPAVVLIPDGPKLYPLAQAGIVEEPVIAPRLRVYVTPRNIDISEAPERSSSIIPGRRGAP